MLRTPNRRKWRVGARETELEDFISMSLISPNIFTFVVINSISHSLEQEKYLGLSRGV